MGFRLSPYTKSGLNAILATIFENSVYYEMLDPTATLTDHVFF